jgi:signal transduction histidine kinase
VLNISSTFLRKVQELERANASKDRLFSIIGHDLRNPAAALQHVAGLISYYSKKGTPEQLINTSNHIVKAAKTLNEILDNLLSWSVTQTGDLKMQPLKISLPLLVKEAVDIFQDTAVSKDIRLDVHAPTELMVIADRNAILTILAQPAQQRPQIYPSWRRCGYKPLPERRHCPNDNSGQWNWNNARKHSGPL